MSDENNQMIQIHTKLGALEEKTKNLENRLNGFERVINDKLNKIEENLKSNNEANERKLKTIDEKVDSILELQSKLKGGWKMASWIGSLCLILAGFFTWVVDKWENIKGVIF